MDEKELTIPKIDLIFIFRIWLRYAKRFWAMALIFAFLCAGVLGYTGYRAYTPVYEASVSFTVKAAIIAINSLFVGFPFPIFIV